MWYTARRRWWYHLWHTGHAAVGTKERSWQRWSCLRAMCMFMAAFVAKNLAQGQQSHSSSRICLATQNGIRIGLPG